MSKINMSLISLARAVRLMKKPGREGLTAVIVVTNDARIWECPELTVCALRVTEKARARILETGGEVFTFDQVALEASTDSKAGPLQGRENAHEAVKHLGPAPGVRHSHTQPFARSEGRKFGRARLRRKSCVYKK